MDPTQQSALSRAWPSPVIAWGVVALLVIAAIVAFIDRQVVAIVVDPMKQDLGINDAQVGWLYGVFAVFYAIAAVPIAWVADHKSRTGVISIGILLWSAMTVLCGLSKQYWLVLLARIGVGVGEATLSPATNSLLGDYFPRPRLPLAMSVFQTGAIMGSGIAFVIGGYVLAIVESAPPLVLPMVGELAPWQQTFVYLGLPGVVLALIFAVIKEPARRTPLDGQKSGPGELVRFYRANLKTLTLHHVGNLSFALMGYAFVFWTVSYFVRVHGMEAADASQTFGWIFLLAGPLGPILIARLATHLQARGYGHANISAGLVGGLLALPFIIAIQFVPTAFWAFVLYVPAMIFVNSPFGIAAGALPVIAPPALRAQVAAVYLLASALGMMLGPPLAGAFNEWIFPGPEGVRYSLISLTGLFGLIGCVCLWFARHPYAKSLANADAQHAEE